MSLDIALTEPQSRFVQLTETYPAFVAGYGSGKSQTLITNVIIDLFNNRGADIGVYSPTFDLNALNLIPRFEQAFDEMGLRYENNKARGIMRVQGYGAIIYRSMDVPKRIVGYEVFRSHIDELDTLPEIKASDVWNRIIARTRQKVLGSDGKTLKNRASAYTTPESFQFCYKRWKKNPGEGYAMVQAPTYSNPHLPPEYIQNLRDTYPSQLIDAYIEGEFVNLTSGSVYYAFDRDFCNTDVVQKPKEPLLVGMDFNVTKMCATIHVRRGKTIHAVGELFNLRDTPDMIDALKEVYPENNITVYPDASGRGTTSKSASTSDIKLLKQGGFTVRAKSTNPRIKNRVSAMNKSFESELYKVNVSRCPEYTEALEQQPYNPTTSQPLKDGDLDNKVDGGGYLIHYLFPVVKPTLTQTNLQGF